MKIFGKLLIVSLSAVFFTVSFLSAADTIQIKGNKYEVKEIQVLPNGSDDNTRKLIKRKFLISSGDTKTFSRYSDYFSPKKLNNGVYFTGASETNVKCSGNQLMYISTGSREFLGGFENMYFGFKNGGNSFLAKTECKQDTKSKMKNAIDKIPFNELGISTKETNNGPIILNLSNTASNGIISKDKIKNKLLNDANPQSQPTFTDIAYLQIKIINKATKSLSTLGVSDLENIFDGSSYDEFEKWSNKFLQFVDKDSFVDSMSGAITLKDIGIGNEIVGGLIESLNCKYTSCGNINNNISISKPYSDKYKFYSLDEVVNDIYTTGSNDKIGDKFLNLYSSLSGLQNNDLGSGLNSSEKTLLNNFLGKTFGDGESVSPDELKLGYGLQTRVRNLKNFKDVYSNNTGVNLLGVYNFYYELNSAVKGAEKISKLKERYKNGKVDDFIKKDLPILKSAEIDSVLSRLTSYDFSTGDITNTLKEKDIISSDNIDIKNSCYSFNKNNINTTKDKFKLLRGISINGIQDISSSSSSTTTTTTISLEKLKNTKYQKYIKGNCLEEEEEELELVAEADYNSQSDMDLTSNNYPDISAIYDDFGEKCTPLIYWEEDDGGKPIFENEDCVEHTSNTIGDYPYRENIIGNFQPEYSNDDYIDQFKSTFWYDPDTQIFSSLPANLEGGAGVQEESGIFIDNRNTTNSASQDYLKYDVSSLISSSDKFAIEVSVRGAALKREGDYMLRSTNSNNYYLKLKNGDLKLKNNDNGFIEVKLKLNMSDVDLNDNKFYTVRFERYDDGSKLKVNGIKVENNDFKPSGPNELYIGNIIGHNSNYYQQRNDIINFVKIYKD